MKIALFLGPALVAVVIAMGPVISGEETFFYRDISHFHLQAKWSQVQAWSDGRLPFIDLPRGGDTSLGNPNTVPLYPTNLLYAIAGFTWAFNAHFWLHLMLAPWAVYWLARTWGLRRPGAYCAGVAYALSGYYLSQFGFYNLVAGTALAPALVASSVVAARSLARRAPGGRCGARLVVMGALWGLVLLAGDPIIALQAGVLSLLAVAIDRWPGRGERGSDGGGAPSGLRWALGVARGLPWLAGATLLGTLVAAPQYVEMLRILPYSYRFQIFTARQALLASWDPRQLAEWFIPFVFGRPQLNYWGYRFSGDEVPLFFSLFPGTLALALALVAGRPRARGHLWAWLGVSGGLFVVLGSFNPAMGLVARLPGLQLLRFPIKFWLPVAIGAALLVGIGFERCREPAVRRNLVRALGLLLLLYIAFAAFLVQFPTGVEQWVEDAMKQPQPPGRPVQVRLNWLALSLLQAALVGVYLALAWWAKRAPALAGGGAVALHAASQLFLLQPLYATDRVDLYREPPPILAHVGPDQSIVHGEIDELFGATRAGADFPDGRAHWVERRGRLELYPFVGIPFGRSYELTVSPEGLASFFTVGAVHAMRLNGDDVRVRIARTAGADVLILKRPFEDPESLGVRLRVVMPTFQSSAYVYEVLDSPDEYVLAGRVAFYERLDEVLQAIMSPQFDPRSVAVVPGPPRQVDAPSGEVEVVSDTPNRIELEVRSEAGGMLVAQRVYLPIYRAAIDGAPARVTVANLHRLGVEVPPGEHRLELWIDQGAFFRSLWASGAGLGGLIALPWLVRRRRVGSIAGGEYASAASAASAPDAPADLHDAGPPDEPAAQRTGETTGEAP
ncbi:MAG TPA: hypothetical protein VMV46_21945 [Thermoanaerobaculia bacterium]|nr:hypothetical protein [Thermoanaerobaculia bacterium]